MFRKKRKPKHVHEWSRWEEVDAIATNVLTGKSREVTAQVRECASCGFQEMVKI